MSSHPAENSPKPVGIALTGGHLAALLEGRDLAARLDAAGLAFAVGGVDRIDGSAPGERTVESTIGVSALAVAAPRLGWLAAAAVHRDHPYNLARRVASADHLAGGRGGLVLGLSDGYAPGGQPAGREAWGGAGLTDGVPLGVPTTRDAATAIRDLWLSWPYASIVADRATGIYALGEQIGHIDHRGVFDVEGPLTVPTTPQTAPVLAWYARTPEEAEAAQAIAEVVIRPAARAVSVSATGTARLYLEFPVPNSAPEPGPYPLAARLAARLADDGVAGIILRPTAGERALARFLGDIVPALTEAGILHDGWTGTLRDRMSLPEPPPLTGTRPAFPAPAPLRARGLRPGRVGTEAGRREAPRLRSE
jgi:hypothetical protein